MEKLVDEEAEELLKNNKISDKCINDDLSVRIWNLYKYDTNDCPDLFRNRLHIKEMFSLFGDNKLLSIVKYLLNDCDDIRIFPNYSARPKIP